jgi:hypothetical protein
VRSSQVSSAASSCRAAISTTEVLPQGPISSVVSDDSQRYVAQSTTEHVIRAAHDNQSLIAVSVFASGTGSSPPTYSPALSATTHRQDARRLPQLSPTSPVGTTGHFRVRVGHLPRRCHRHRGGSVSGGSCRARLTYERATTALTTRPAEEAGFSTLRVGSIWGPAEQICPSSLQRNCPRRSRSPAPISRGPSTVNDEPGRHHFAGGVSLTARGREVQIAASAMVDDRGESTARDEALWPPWVHGTGGGK